MATKSKPKSLPLDWRKFLDQWLRGAPVTELGDDDADDAIQDNPSAPNIISAQDNLSDSKDDLFDAVEAYFGGNYSKALDYAENALDNAEDAFDDADGVSEADEADNLIDEVEDKLAHEFPATEILIHIDPEGQVDKEGVLPTALAEEATR